MHGLSNLNIAASLGYIKLACIDIGTLITSKNYELFDYGIRWSTGWTIQIRNGAHIEKLFSK